LEPLETNALALVLTPALRIDGALKLIPQCVFLITPIGINAIGLFAKFRAVIDHHVRLARAPTEAQVPLWRSIAIKFNARSALRAFQRRERYKIIFKVQGPMLSL
jgi:hypothetical protein